VSTTAPEESSSEEDESPASGPLTLELLEESPEQLQTKTDTIKNKKIL
jgi:hypothetical protein